MQLFSANALRLSKGNQKKKYICMSEIDFVLFALCNSLQQFQVRVEVNADLFLFYTRL